jgi:hypothetical protein
MRKCTQSQDTKTKYGFKFKIKIKIKTYFIAFSSLDDKDTNINWTNLDTIDQQLTKIKLTSETVCASKRYHHRWTPAIHNISLYLRLWRIRKQQQKSGRDIHTIEDSILQQLKDPYKQQLLEAAPITISPARALRILTKLKRKWQREETVKREDGQLAQTQRQYKITKSALNHQLQTSSIHRKIRTVTKTSNNTQLKTLDIPSTDSEGNTR